MASQRDSRSETGGTWETREERAGTSKGQLVARLVRVLGYDDLGEGGGPVVELDGASRVVLGGGSRGVTTGPDGLEVRVLDRYMSRAHATLHLSPTGEWELEDLTSRNGTRIDGKTVTRAPLREGQWFETGHTVWMIRRAPRGSPLEVELGPTVSYSPIVASLSQRLQRLATSLVPIVIAGPTGSGKEVVARDVHRASARRGEMVAVNCGAIVGTLLESELFGHVRGAFTGATADRRGYVEAADGGSLFLDEISELPLSAQVRLLRVLELGEVVRVGSVSPIKIDLRILSASSRDLEELVDEGSFRADLYARLAGYVLVLPPLAQRKEDLGSLLAHIVGGSGSAVTPALDAAAGRALLADDWPLNVRGLRRVVESAIALAADRPIELDDLPARFRADAPPDAEPEFAIVPAEPLSESDAKLRDEIVAALQACDGNVTRAAASVGKHRQQLQRWMKRLGIDRS